jgi:serine/threonine-protein kinase
MGDPDDIANGNLGAPTSSTQPTLGTLPQRTLAEGLARREPQLRSVYLLFGVFVALAGLIGVFWTGGDDTAKRIFQASMAWFALVNLLAWLLASRFAQVSRGMLVAQATCGLVGSLSLFYLGPFSAFTMVYVLVVMFVALSRERAHANIALVVTIIGHLLVTMPIILGLTEDVGLIRALGRTRGELAVIEVLLLSIVSGGYILGRRVRRIGAAALTDLADARRIIADQQQVLVEVEDRVEQINRVKGGRWSGQTVGRWKLGSVLGRGAMGEVYEAEDAQGQQAAVKFLTAAAEESPSLVGLFHRELQIASHLDSPHVVKVLEVSNSAASVPYLAMERLAGTDLAAHLRTELRMSVKDVVGMLRQVAEGLEIAHSAGVVHRDLKPQNLFLHDARCWKILDFGVAKISGVEATVTKGLMVGTPQYMAPEQATGKAISPLTDVYALGAVAYRCLTGRAPYPAKDFAALVVQLVTTAPARPGTLAKMPREVEDVLAIAMAKDPTRRFKSAMAFADELAAAAKGLPPKSRAPADAWADEKSHPRQVADTQIYDARR